MTQPAPDGRRAPPAATGHDVIGDVHGHGDELHGLLATMGYVESGGAHAHPDDRRVVFVGDLIDRGREQLRTLEIARAMVEAGTAQIVLGNHEFNAVAFVTPRADGPGYCRPDTPKNRGQHQIFLDAVREGSATHREWIEWFRTIPLWLDLGALRVVHACWSRVHMELLEQHLAPGRTLTTEVVTEGTTRGTPLHQAVEVVLKGPEVALGEGRAYRDRGGVERRRARWSWWDPEATTLRRGAFVPRDALTPTGESFPELPDTPIVEEPPPQFDGGAPVIFGHYWWTGTPTVLGPKLACVDYSVAGDGPLVAYRWNVGDSSLTDDRFVQYRSG